MKSILIVDDREENLYLLQVLLTHHGYRVDSAHDGAEALAKARRAPPDLIISDILMPVMDGFALCRAWKADAQLKHVPLVFYTATYTDSGDERLALDLGADAFIVKPAEPEAFMARIRAVLAATVEQPAAPRAPTDAETVLLKEYNQVLVRKLEQKLLQLESCEQYSFKLFEYAPDGILIADSQSSYLDANPAICRMLGYSRAELIGMQARDIAAPSEVAHIKPALQAIQAHADYHREWQLRRKDGSLFDAAVSATTMPDGDLLVIVRDITEHKRAQDALRMREAQLALIFDNVGDVLFVVRVGNDGEFYFASMNRRGLEATGLAESQIVGLRVADVIPATSLALVLDNYRQAITTRQPVSWEEVSDYPAGRKYGIVTVAPVFDARGNCTQLIGTVHDITAINQTEAELRIAATAFESHEGMLITDAQVRILKINRAFTTITGYSTEEVIGKNPKLLSSGHQDASFYAAMWASLNDTGAWEGEIWNRRKNGEIYPEHLTITAVKDPHGKVTNYVGALTDSTQRQQALEQLRSTASQLAQANAQIEEERAMLAERVKERTAQLQYANHAKDSFLATMSHEIRTPLGGLLGMMELLGLSRLDDRQIEMLKAAQDSGKNLLRIVNDILDWSKIEAGKLELAPRAATLAETLQGVAATYAQLASSKGIRLQLQVDDDLAAAHVFDPLRVSQILNNFTSNAIKFTEHGTIKIGAQRLAHDNGRETVRFCVTDSGVGIAPEQQARLFQHYEQASADTARMYGGTGLGLAICRRLAELMDGTLSVESTSGAGSTFCLTVSLPLASPSEQRALQTILDKQEIRAEEAEVAPLSAHGQHLSILVVDDHPLNRMLLKQQLEQLGLRAEIAAYGMVALSLWQAGHYDLVITDCHMPEMDGYELARSIREIEQHEGRPRVPIIAWTANVLADEEVRCKKAGMDDMLTKPTELAELRAMLLKWACQPGGNVSPPVAPTAAPTAAAMDFGALQKFAASPALQVEMLQEFNTHNRSDLANLQATLKAGDPAAVVSAAHRMKGACRMVGALQLSALCEHIERTARQGAMPGAETARQLDEAVARVEAEISWFAGSQ